jgi:hypothetical protein
MSHRKFSGILNEIIKRYPNIDVVDFLEFELGIPRFKAEALAKRIEERYCRKDVTAEPKIQRFLEKQEDSEQSPNGSAYSVDCLSKKMFEHFVCWMLEELGYGLQPEKNQTGFGFSMVATRGNEKVAFQAIRCPATYKVSNIIISLSEQLKEKQRCDRAIVIATSAFSQQAIEEAQKANVELWDRNTLTQKIVEARKKGGSQEQSRFPPFQGTLLQSLLRLKDGKDFLLEPKTEDKYDLLLPGVKYPLLTFQVQRDEVTRVVFRIKYNEPVSESEGEKVIEYDGGSRVGPEDLQAYSLVTQYLEQFLE